MTRQPQSSPPRVLVVDDEPHQVETICRGLKINGFECVGLTRSDDALRMLDTDEWEQLDILLTDLSMPGTSGVELIEQVLAKRPGFPIVVITGLAPCKETDTLSRRGILSLSKPFEPDELIRTLNRCLHPDSP